MTSTPTNEPAAHAPAGRSGRKRQAIVEAARKAFLQRGYGGTSMDEIAALAAVSKQTVYKNFTDKEGLFTQIIIDDIHQTEGQSQPQIQALHESNDVEADLRQFARQHVKLVLQPHLVQMRRMLIGEASRFPDLARTWYETGPGRAYTTLGELFAALDRRGQLKVEDPLVAAQHFNWLILSVPLNQAMFLGDAARFTSAELDSFADDGVRVFLAAYGPGDIK